MARLFNYHFRRPRDPRGRSRYVRASRYRIKHTVYTRSVHSTRRAESMSHSALRLRSNWNDDNSSRFNIISKCVVRARLPTYALRVRHARWQPNNIVVPSASLGVVR